MEILFALWLVISLVFICLDNWYLLFEKTGDRYAPKTTVTLSEADHAKLIEILEKIDAHDDVEEVYTNAE